MKSKVYTLTGDKGATALVGGKRVAKDCVRVEAYGTVDELNSNIGLLIHDLPTDVATTYAPLLHKVQCKLFNIGAYLATEPTRQAEISYAVFCLKKKTQHQTHNTKLSPVSHPSIATQNN